MRPVPSPVHFSVGQPARCLAGCCRHLLPRSAARLQGRLTSRDEDGSVLPLLVALVIAVAVAVTGLARLGAAATSRATAQQAADAAALAGARIDRVEADRLASANGALVVGWSERFDGAAHIVTVEVVLDDVNASAQARWDPPPPPPTLPPTLPPTTETTTTLTTNPEVLFDRSA